MVSPLRRFAPDQHPELDVSLRLMERKIDGWVTQSLSDGSVVPANNVRWDVPEHPAGPQPAKDEWDYPQRSMLLQATRHLTFPRAKIGHGTLLVARALGTDKQEPREKLYGIRTKMTALEWYAGEQITPEDIICTRLGMEWQGDVRKVAAGLLGCLNRAYPTEHDVQPVPRERYTGLVIVSGQTVAPTHRSGNVLDAIPKII